MTRDRQIEQIKQNARRARRYREDSEYRQRVLAYNRPYVAKANQKRAERRAEERHQ